MSDDDGQLTTRNIVQAIKDSQEPWWAKLFWSPAAVGFLTMLALLFFVGIVFLANSEHGVETLQFLTELFD